MGSEVSNSSTNAIAAALALQGKELHSHLPPTASHQPIPRSNFCRRYGMLVDDVGIKALIMGTHGLRRRDLVANLSIFVQVALLMALAGGWDSQAGPRGAGAGVQLYLLLIVKLVLLMVSRAWGYCLGGKELGSMKASVLCLEDPESDLSGLPWAWTEAGMLHHS